MLTSHHLIRTANYTNRLYVWLCNYRFRTCPYAGIPSTLVLGKYRHNWSKKEINGKRAIQVIRATEKILLLPLIQWGMIHANEKYKTNVFFSFQISWITRFTDPNVQTNRTLMFSYKPPIIWALRQAFALNCVNYFCQNFHLICLTRLNWPRTAVLAASVVLTVRYSSKLRDLIIHPIILGLKYNLKENAKENC